NLYDTNYYFRTLLTNIEVINYLKHKFNLKAFEFLSMIRENNIRKYIEFNDIHVCIIKALDHNNELIINEIIQNFCNIQNLTLLADNIIKLCSLDILKRFFHYLIENKKYSYININDLIMTSINYS